MSKQGQNNKNKLSDFEPEVDDLTVDQSWEKIRYFLPQEKKRRGFFWLFEGSGLLTSVAVVGILVASVFFLINEETDRKKPERSLAAGAEKNAAKQKEKQSERGQLIVKEKQNENENVGRVKGEVKINENVVGNEKAGNGEEKNIRGRELTETKNNGAVAPVLTKEQEKPESRAVAVTDIVTTAPDQESKPAEINRNDATTSPDTRSVNQLSDSSVVGVDVTDTLSYLHLPVIFPRISFGDSLTIGIKPVSNLSSLRNVLMLELSGGIGQTNTDIGIAGFQRDHQSVNPGAGLGVIYVFKNRLQLNGHLIFAGNETEAQTTSLRNKVYKKEMGSSSINPGLPLDTFIYYVRIQSLIRSSSKLSAGLHLGIGFTLFSRSRFSADVFCQAAVRSSVYTFEFEHLETRDSLLFVRTSTSAPLRDEIVNVPAGAVYATRVTNLSLVPGITLSYFITRRTAVIIKPMYFWQLKNTSVTANETVFDLRQRALFLNVGLRLKF